MRKNYIKNTFLENRTDLLPTANLTVISITLNVDKYLPGNFLHFYFLQTTVATD